MDSSYFLKKAKFQIKGHRMVCSTLLHVVGEIAKTIDYNYSITWDRF